MSAPTRTCAVAVRMRPHGRTDVPTVGLPTPSKMCSCALPRLARRCAAQMASPGRGTQATTLCAQPAARIPTIRHTTEDWQSPQAHPRPCRWDELALTRDGRDHRCHIPCPAHGAGSTRSSTGGGAELGLVGGWLGPSDQEEVAPPPTPSLSACRSKRSRTCARRLPAMWQVRNVVTCIGSILGDHRVAPVPHIHSVT